MKKTIEIGDLVRVDLNGAQYTLCFKAEVFKIPYATGDTWGFLDKDTGKQHWVSELCTITLLDKEELNKEPPF